MRVSILLFVLWFWKRNFLFCNNRVRPFEYECPRNGSLLSTLPLNPITARYFDKIYYTYWHVLSFQSFTGGELFLLKIILPLKCVVLDQSIVGKLILSKPKYGLKSILLMKAYLCLLCCYTSQFGTFPKRNGVGACFSPPGQDPSASIEKLDLRWSIHL